MTGEAEKDATCRFTLRLCDKYSAKKELKEQSQTYNDTADKSMTLDKKN